jgi:CheY-like chemotaxis protein
MMSSAIQPLQLTVLVVDDEEPLRHYMGRVLADDGYRVLVAGNGLEALALLEKCAPGIHLVVTDVSMPMMTGPEMAAHIATQPEPPPVLLCPAVTVTQICLVHCSESHFYRTI